MADKVPYSASHIHDIQFLEYNVGCFVKICHDDVLECFCYIGFQFKVVDPFCIESSFVSSRATDVAPAVKVSSPGAAVSSMNGPLSGMVA